MRRKTEICKEKMFSKKHILEEQRFSLFYNFSFLYLKLKENIEIIDIIEKFGYNFIMYDKKLLIRGVQQNIEEIINKLEKYPIEELKIWTKDRRWIRKLY